MSDNVMKHVRNNVRQHVRNNVRNITDARLVSTNVHVRHLLLRPSYFCGSFLVLQRRPSCYSRKSVCGTCLSGPPTFMAPFLFYKGGPAAIRESPSAVLAPRAFLLLWLLSCFTREAQLLSTRVRLRYLPLGPSYFYGSFLVLGDKPSCSP